MSSQFNSTDSAGEGETPSLTTWAPPGHFYSPIVDPTDAVVAQTLAGFDQTRLAPDDSLCIDEAAMLNHLVTLAPLCADIPFPPSKTDDARYYFENPAFSYGDGTIYFAMIRWLRPRRIIEVGAGFSSCLAMDTNDRFFDALIELTFIDPFPEILLGLLDDQDPYRQCILPSRIQDTSIEVFERLQANDILFIDSSHVSKLGSDVNDYMFRILPRLKAGVVIHIHDIPYPFEYGPAWIVDENRSWNEAYLLRSFLQYNPRFRIIYFNHLVKRLYAANLAKRIPICLKNCGASIWLRKQE